MKQSSGMGSKIEGKALLPGSSINAEGFKGDLDIFQINGSQAGMKGGMLHVNVRAEGDRPTTGEEEEEAPQIWNFWVFGILGNVRENILMVLAILGN